MCFNIVFILFFSTAADLKVIIDDNNYILALKMCIQNINHYRNIKKKISYRYCSLRAAEA